MPDSSRSDPTDLTTVGHRLLDEAHASSAGRAAVTVYGGSNRRLRQTMLALRAGEGLAEHENPGEATLQVLTGQVELRSAEGTETVAAGRLVPVPASRHSLTAAEDALLLLTVVPD